MKKGVNHHEKIKNSILGKSKIWKNNHYEELSAIINDCLLDKIQPNTESFYHLGNSISQITLKRLFEGNVKSSAHHDLHFIKTLEKLAIFLGYEDLNHFISASQQDNSSEENVYEITEQDFQLFKKIIYGSCLNEFNAMKKLPEIDMSKINEYVISGSPFEKRISLYLKKLQSLEMIMEIDASNIEVYDYKIMSVEGNMIVINTNEFWNLLFEKDGSHNLFLNLKMNG